MLKFFAGLALVATASAGHHVGVLQPEKHLSRPALRMHELIQGMSSLRTQYDGQCDNFDQFDTVMNAAATNHDDFSSYMKHLIDGLKDKGVAIYAEKSGPAPTKNKERACLKCKCKYKGQTCDNMVLRDVERASIVCDTAEDVVKAAVLLNDAEFQKTNAYTIQEIKNGFADNDGRSNHMKVAYTDVKVIVHLQGFPILAEVQLHLKPMLMAKSDKPAGKMHGHDMYKNLRTLEELKKQLDDQIKSQVEPCDLTSDARAAPWDIVTANMQMLVRDLVKLAKSKKDHEASIVGGEWLGNGGKQLLTSADGLEIINRFVNINPPKMIPSMIHYVNMWLGVNGLEQDKIATAISTLQPADAPALAVGTDPNHLIFTIMVSLFNRGSRVLYQNVPHIDAAFGKIAKFRATKVGKKPDDDDSMVGKVTFDSFAETIAEDTPVWKADVQQANVVPVDIVADDALAHVDDDPVQSDV